jgi:hypothetical protein
MSDKIAVISKQTCLFDTNRRHEWWEANDERTKEFILKSVDLPYLQTSLTAQGYRFYMSTATLDEIREARGY